MASDAGTQRPPFVEAPLDRRTEERVRADLVDTLRRDRRSRIVVVHGDTLAVTSGGGLRSVPYGEISPEAQWGFLGRDVDGRGVLAASLSSRSSPPSGRWASLREFVAGASSTDASVAVSAVGLGRWLVDSGYCPTCGSRADLIDAGWARRCSGCGRELFPRTDPAVIVAVASVDGQRLLLGSNTAWEPFRYSCFAGFVEAGESLEDTVAREVAEEGGVRLTDVRYVASQAWPFPRSLMVGFRANAERDDDARPDGVEIGSVRWFTREEVGDALRGVGDLVLPGAASVARSLIRSWHDGSGS